MADVLVVGGGIGGLSLARELSLRGLRATVLEKAPQLNPVGAGIIMNPNAMRVLERNGLAEAVRADSWPYLCRETCDEQGRMLAMRDYRPLYDAGKLARGETFEAGVLVGADGIHPQVRGHVFGDFAPVYMGYRSHRMVVENTGVAHFTEFLGHGRRIGLVPISEKRLYVWTTFNLPHNGPPGPERVADFRALFDEFTDPRVARVFSQLRSMEGVIPTAIEELALERWVQGRAALLGDAVHAMTPNIGQGAGMAMEDAALLAEELACRLRNRRIRRQGRNVEQALDELERLLAHPS